MKKIITILFLIIAYTSFAQQSTPDSAKFAWYRYQYGLRQPRIQSDTLQDIPKDTIYSKYGLARKGSVFYVGNGISWTPVTGCDTCLVKVFAFDTLTVKAILQNGDTIPAFVMILDSSWYVYSNQTFVKIGDTASMLDPYKFHEIITYQKTLINQGVTPLSQYNQIDAGGFEQDRRNSPLWYDEAMNTTDSSKAILALNASNADSPLVRLQAQNIAGDVTSKIEINKHWPQISKNGGAGKNIVTSINGTSLADTSGNVTISTGATYTATHGVVIQGTNIKLQDTLNGAGTKFMWLFNKHAFRAGSVTGGSATNWDYDSIGTGSVAMGDNSKATGLGGIAIGRGATAAGQSIALGTFSHALGGNSVAIATLSSNSANGTNSISIGDNIATGTGSISMNGDAFADKSVAIGAGTTAKHYAGSVFGYFNDTATAASATTFNLLNRAFQVGIGNGSSGADQYRNGLTILFNGKTTLNKYGAGTFTGTPTYVLAVNSAGDIIETALSGGGSVTNVTGTAPVIITGTSTIAPNVTVDTSKAIGRLATFTDVGGKLDKTTITEQKIYYRGEIYKSKSINTSTGAIGSDTSRSITDYLPVTPSESITISSSTYANITIYGWTYDSSLTAISEIRSNSLISTGLNSYTFTTPSNAAYLNIYIKYASVDFRDILKINSTNSISYTSPVTPEQYTGTTIQKIQSALDFARFTSSAVELKGNYLITSTIIMNSGNKLILNNARVTLDSLVHDNIIRNEAILNPAWRIFARGNVDVKIIGRGNSIFYGSKENWGSDNPTGVGTQRWRSNGLRFANVKDFEISGLTFKATNANPLDFEQCRYGIISNIRFDQGLEHLNQGGIEIVRGSHDITVQNIYGKCQDDIVAIGNIKGNENLHVLGFTIYDPYAANLDVHSLIIKNIQRDPVSVSFGGTPVLYGSAIRFLTTDSMKIHDVELDGVTGYQNIFFQQPGGGYQLNTLGGVDDIYNIAVSNTGKAPIYFYGPIKNSSFINVAATDSTGLYTACVPYTGSSKIYRKYYNSTGYLIDTVNSNNEGSSLNIKTALNATGLTINSVVGFPLASFQIDGAARAFTGVARLASDIVQNSTVGDYVIRTASYPIRFTTNGGTSITASLLVNGNFGLGVNTPAYKLDVNGDVNMASGSGMYIQGSGTNRGIKFSNPSITDNISVLAAYPSAGTNVTSQIQIIPKGTGFSSTIKSTLLAFNTDFVADATNWEGISLQAEGASYSLRSRIAGTGTLRPIYMAADNTATQLNLLINGNVGIGTASPTSKLHTAGSFATAYVAKTATYTATASDDIIECTSGTFTVTLPTSVGITGREYWITNTGSGTITIGTTSSQTFVNVTATPTTLTVAQFSNYRVVSNGANWLAYKIVN